MNRNDRRIALAALIVGVLALVGIFLTGELTMPISWANLVYIVVLANQVILEKRVSQVLTMQWVSRQSPNGSLSTQTLPTVRSCYG